MFDALQIAATGMHAQQQNVDTIANNLANVTTTGFKKSRLTFTDMVERGAAVPVDGPSAGVPTAPVDARGVGVGIASASRQFDAGEMRESGSPYDVAIAGDGFLEVMMPDGSRAYSRGGTLRISADGQLATAGDRPLKPGISIPDDAQDLSIAVDGRVLVRTARQKNAVEVGRLELVRFAGTTGLEALGDNLYRSTEASGEPIAGRAGQDGIGSLRQGFLEGSNVKLVEEMVNLMVAQRAYEASLKVAQASDEMLGMVNNLRK